SSPATITLVLQTKNGLGGTLFLQRIIITAYRIPFAGQRPLTDNRNLLFAIVDIVRAIHDGRIINLSRISLVTIGSRQHGQALGLPAETRRHAVAIPAFRIVLGI